MGRTKSGHRCAGRWSQCAIVTAGCLALSAAAHGQCWDGEFIGNDSEWGDMFGWSVDLSADGNKAIVGGMYNDGLFSFVGGAYIFERTGDGWRQIAKLSSPDPSHHGYFGAEVALHPDGDEACILDNTGLMYLFQQDGDEWLLSQTFDDLSARFDGDIAYSRDGSTLVVGAEFGQTRVFDREDDAWVVDATFTGGPVTAVAISANGDTIAVGSDASGHHIIIHERTTEGWSTDTESFEGEGVGFRSGLWLSPDGQQLMIDRIFYSGRNAAVKVYERSQGTWMRTAIIAPEPEWDGRDFGVEIVASSDGSLVLIGNARDSDPVETAGAVCVYRKVESDYQLVGKFTPADAASVDSFGYAMALSADASTLLVGAPFGAYQSTIVLGSGVAYVMSLDECVPDFASMGDLDGDFDIDDFDLGILLNAYEKTAEGDVDGDGDTDQHDLGILLKHYGQML